MIKHTSYLGKQNGIKLLRTSSLKPLLLVLVICILVIHDSLAQSISCHGNINVSLNSECEYEVTPEVLSSGNLGACASGYSVMLTDHYNVIISSSILDGTHLGQTIKAKLIDNCTNNACWGSILVEDKIPPKIDCREIEVICLDMEAYLPIAIDNCDPTPEIIQVGQSLTLEECTGDFVKTITRDYVAKDDGGYTSAPCTQTIHILRLDPSDISYPADLINDNALVCNSGYAVDVDGHPNVTITGVPTIIKELILNGGFETTNFTGWNISGVSGQLIPNNVRCAEYRSWSGFDRITACEGSCFAVTAFDGNGPGNIILSQNIIVPNAGSTLFNWSEWIAYRFTDLRRMNRMYNVEIRTEDGSKTLDTLYSFTAPEGGIEIGTGWVDHSIDISHFGGQNIQIVFVENIPDRRAGRAHLAIDCVKVTNKNIVYPTINDICKARVTYKDFVVGKDGCLTKIMREWSYVDACSSYDDINVHTQAIWIRDTVPPTLLCPHPIVVAGSPLSGNSNAHGWGVGNGGCKFGVSIPPVSGSDNCSGISRYEVLIDSNLVLVQNGGLVELAADTFELMYVAFDGCGSSDTCVTELVVLDNSAPVAVCDRHSVVGLTNDGTVEVEAFVFDDGSFDDCGLQKMEVARMGNLICDPLDYEFGESISFCCSDIGTENMVAFRVWDFTGRHNDCMVTVEIQDKTGQNAKCPSDRIINCDDPYTLTDLSEFGVATAGGNCNASIFELDPVVDLDDCNRGTILRRWGNNPGDVNAVCYQEITIKIPYEFTFDNIDNVLVRPNNIDTSGACGLDLLPDNLPVGSQRPEINGGVCDLLGATYKDEVFTFDEVGACLKILRTWTVINWCADPDKNTVAFAQVIKVNNTVGPTVSLDRDNPEEVCTFDTNCEDGPITLSASAFDDCTSDESLRGLYILDAYNDGINDDTTFYSGSEITVTTNYPIGTHRAIFTFIDECGNITSRQHIFTIKNCKAPTCALIDGLSISLQAMDTDGDGTPDNEMACLWASDFDASSIGACTDSVAFYFNPAGTDAQRCFSCCDTGANLVKVYVFDEFGNSTYCETTVNVYDHNDVNFCITTVDCPDTRVTVRECNPNLNPSILGMPVIGDGCVCTNFQAVMSETTRSTTEGCRVLVRTWTTSCDGVSVPNDCEQRITIRNEQAPVLTNCPGHMNVNLGNSSSCEAFVNLREPLVESGCNDDVTITHDSPFADMQGINASGIYPAGETVVIYTATNACGDSDQCRFTVNVSGGGDLTCKSRDITVSILEDGSVTVGPSQLDNGSTNSCGDVNITGTNTTFRCDDAGTTQSVTYFIEDSNGNREGCTANVTVNPVPQPVCNSRDITVSIGTNGTVTVDPTTLFNGSSGGVCSDFTLGGIPSTFDCSDSGTTETLSYSITTSNGQVINCTGSVSINSESQPACSSSDITVSLGANGTVTVDPATLYNGTIGGSVCNNITIGGNPITFGCDESGTTQSVNYTITSNSGQVLTCTGNVTINAEGQPTCNSRDITVSLGDNGSVTVDPITLFQGNTNGLCGNVTVAGVPVTYDCCDAGNTNTVTYTLNGSITCTAEVVINPESTPSCVTQDITVSLSANGTLEVNSVSLYNGADGLCFEIEGTNSSFDCDDAGSTQVVSYNLVSNCDNTSISCSGNVVINPVDGIMITCPDDQTIACGSDISNLSIFGNATASAGCGGGAITPTESVVSNVGACDMGTITRTFTATDANSANASCIQIITISGPTNGVSEADITWPTSPVPIADCLGVAPEEGSPQVNTSNAECSDISITSEDGDLIRNGSTSCEGRIIRTWTVTDACQSDGSGGGVFIFQQIFDFTDDEDPSITLPADISIVASSGDCEAIVNVAGIDVTDNCDANLTIRNDSPFADTNDSANINGTYPVGVHDVVIMAEDRCGNSAQETIRITVTSENDGFTFECKKKIFPITDNQTVTVHIDSIACVFADCISGIEASYDRINVISSRTYDCSILNDIATTLYFHENNSLLDSCRILVTIADPSRFCTSGISQSDISGFIRTESGNGLGAAVIELEGSELPSISTDINGYYAFPPIVNGGSYTVVPEKDDEYLNGVSTLDLIMIQKHILGIDILNSPYKLIAADINDSKSVSAADIVELRKLILGVYDELPDNTSWRAIDANYAFENIADPFKSNLPVNYEIFSLQNDMEIDFVGVKVGDVNQSAKTVEGLTTEVRSQNNLKFEVNREETSSDEVIYHFSSENYIDIEGFQFTIELENPNSFVELKSGLLSLNAENIGLRYLTKGLLTVSYNGIAPMTSESEEFLFSVVIKQEIDTDQPFKINSKVTKAEAYGNDIFGIDLEFNKIQTSQITELKQNNPNPWSEETQVEFILPEKMEATISIYDIGGRILYRVQKPFKKGINIISVKKEDISGYNGVAFYELVSKDIKLIKSMIVIE